MPPRPCCDALSTWLEPGTLRALGDPSRATILLRLAGADGPQTVGQLAAGLPVDMSVVSRHLKVLRDVGVVTAERRGREIRHRLDCADLVHMLRNLADALEACCELAPAAPVPLAATTGTTPTTREDPA
ncbi:metalloregulator ArsR/SmtB family transcription factor [bacterium]|nr:metalloregulator ArsR/SmtB family transcription factor [bacterium]